jgi:proteasome accessory factor B
MLRLIGHLQAGRGFTTRVLAERCDVSRRTIFRDLEVLRDAGVPLSFDPAAQTYRIPDTFYLPPTNFTTEEALAVIVLCQELGDGAQLPFYAPAERAAMKLEASLPANLRRHLGRVTPGIRIRLEPRANLDGNGAVYEQLVAAIASRRAVRIKYDSLTEWTEICTKLCPYRLLFSRRAWYVIGRSSIHRATRTFHIGRIKRLEPLDDSYAMPRGFSVDRYLCNAWHLIPEKGRDRDVIIRFAPMVAQNVAEVSWHKTQRIVRRSDGSIDFHVRVSGLNEISWWILGYGDQAEVLRPTALRNLIAERAERIVQRYRHSRGAAP